MVDIYQNIELWMKHPELMTWEDVLKLENLEKEKPYFQSVKFLIAKHYSDNNHILKTKKISSASSYSTNRNALRKFLLKKSDPLSVITNPTEEKIQGTEKEEKPSTAEETTTSTNVEYTTENLPESQSEIIDLKDEETQEIESIEQTPISSEDTSTGNHESTEEATPEREKILSSINERLEELKKLKEEKLRKRQAELSGLQSPISISPESKHKDKNNPKKKPQRVDNTENNIGHKTEAPKEIISSQLGNVLTHDSKSVDQLLEYIKNRKEEKKSNKSDIVDRFIQNDPQISKLKRKATKGEVNDLSEGNTREFISENLAIIHEKQENYKEAARIYEKLILKYPEKKAYFANRINNLKNK